MSHKSLLVTLLCLHLRDAAAFGSFSSTMVAAPAAKHDPYDQLPAVPSFELTSETVTHGATAWSEWLCLRSCPYVAAHRCL